MPEIPENPMFNMKPNSLIYGARYDRVMEAFGGKGFFVEDPKDIRGALDEAMNHRGPALVNIVLSQGSASKPQRSAGTRNPSQPGGRARPGRPREDGRSATSGFFSMSRSKAATLGCPPGLPERLAKTARGHRAPPVRPVLSGRDQASSNSKKNKPPLRSTSNAATLQCHCGNSRVAVFGAQVRDQAPVARCHCTAAARAESRLGNKAVTERLFIIRSGNGRYHYSLNKGTWRKARGKS